MPKQRYGASDPLAYQFRDIKRRVTSLEAKQLRQDARISLLTSKVSVLEKFVFDYSNAEGAKR